MSPKAPPSPWNEFLTELDASLTQPVELHCLGGFVMTMLYGLPRPTGDVDVISVAPREAYEELVELAGEASRLHKKYKLYIQVVGVACIPEDYRSRLAEMFPGFFNKLRLMALDPYDVVLAKLERNNMRDREDFKFLAKMVPLDREVLSARYREELRPLLGNPDREDLTLKLWIESAYS